MKIIWVVEDQIIPNYGVATINGDIDLPDDLATSFIEQGKAKGPEAAKPVKKSTPIED